MLSLSRNRCESSLLYGRRYDVHEGLYIHFDDDRVIPSLLTSAYFYYKPVHICHYLKRGCLCILQKVYIFFGAPIKK
jgi:hypothetical protein